MHIRYVPNVYYCAIMRIVLILLKALSPEIKTLLRHYYSVFDYRKVASSSMSQLVAHFLIFRRLMKGKFDAYVL